MNSARLCVVAAGFLIGLVPVVSGFTAQPNRDRLSVSCLVVRAEVGDAAQVRIAVPHRLASFVDVAKNGKASWSLRNVHGFVFGEITRDGRPVLRDRKECR